MLSEETKSVYDCDICRETYRKGGEETPCAECDKPILTAENEDAYEAWLMLQRYGMEFIPKDGGFFTMHIKTILDYCRAFDLTKDDFKKIILIENTKQEIEFEKRPQKVGA